MSVGIVFKNAENQFKEEIIGKYMIKVRKDKENPDGVWDPNVECHVGLDVFGLAKLDKC